MSLEQRVRSTLKDAGSRIDTEAEPQPLTATSERVPRQNRPILTFAAAFAAVLLLGVVAFFVSDERSGPAGSDVQPASSGLLGSIVGQLPDGFDPEQAAPMLALEGNPEDVAAQYLKSRIPFVEAGVHGVEEQDGYTLVQWAWGQRLTDDPQSEDGESGWLILRPMLRGFEIVATTTDGVDLSDLTLSDTALEGVVESDTGEFLGADVLNLDGSPVDSAPHPDGFFPDAMSLWGTAGASSPPLALDISVSQPVIIRVNRVGGALLSISEVILGSPEPGETPRTESSGPPLTDQQFQEVFGDEEPGTVIRNSAFLAHSRNQDDLGVFSLYGAKANSVDGTEFDQPANCIYQHGLEGALAGKECGPDVSLDTPGIAISSSCGNPDVTMFSAWAINPEVEHYELVFSDDSNALLEPNRGYLIWAWPNTKHLVDIRAENASPAVQQAIDDHPTALTPPCD